LGKGKRNKGGFCSPYDKRKRKTNKRAKLKMLKRRRSAIPEGREFAALAKKEAEKGVQAPELAHSGV